MSYRKEADMQKAKLDKMKEDGKDEHDVKKMGEVGGCNAYPCLKD